MNDQVVADIRERGHWLSLIRPARYEADRLAFEDLLPTLERCVVRLRGWDVPHISSRDGVGRAENYVFQSSMFQHHIEHWRFYQSGQFVDFAGISEDWRDQSGLYPPPTPAWKPGERVGVTDVVWRYTELLRLAARLSVTSAGDDEMYVSITFRGLRGRELFVDDPNRGSFIEPHTLLIPEFSRDISIDRTTLVAEAAELALDFAYELFLRFGWQAERDILRGLQEELFALRRSD